MTLIASTARRTTLALIGLLCAMAAGCSAASSLGIPFVSGSNSLMPAANELRASQSTAAVAPKELAKTVLTAHRIEPGDILSVESTDFNSGVQLPSDQTVASDGTIDLAAFGSITVAGKTVSEVESTVESLIETTIASKSSAKTPLDGKVFQTGYRSGTAPESPAVNTDVSVRLVSHETDRFYVLGEVTAPGSYPLAGNETVLDALIAAGGVTGQANGHKIILVRPAEGKKKTILPVCYQSIVQLGDTSTNFQVFPGDRIYVPSLSLVEDVRQSLRWDDGTGCPHCKSR
jgi:polysaccharide export outer membrane protein